MVALVFGSRRSSSFAPGHSVFAVNVPVERAKPGRRRGGVTDAHFITDVRADVV